MTLTPPGTREGSINRPIRGKRRELHRPSTRALVVGLLTVTVLALCTHPLHMRPSRDRQRRLRPHPAVERRWIALEALHFPQQEGSVGPPVGRRRSCSWRSPLSPSPLGTSPLTASARHRSQTCELTSAVRPWDATHDGGLLIMVGFVLVSVVGLGVAAWRISRIE